MLILSITWKVTKNLLQQHLISRQSTQIFLLNAERLTKLTITDNYIGLLGNNGFQGMVNLSSLKIQVESFDPLLLNPLFQLSDLDLSNSVLLKKNHVKHVLVCAEFTSLERELLQH
jgi:hypothetical protein